ncbi:MAG: LAGLIDADG family homing endonuclease [Candidatus Nezhaarchaeales archaeon]
MIAKNKRVVAGLNVADMELREWVDPLSFGGTAVFTKAFNRFVELAKSDPAWYGYANKYGLENLLAVFAWSVVNVEIPYRYDTEMFKRDDFWLLPSETWSTFKAGDCEDSVTGDAELYAKINGKLFYGPVEELYKTVRGEEVTRNGRVVKTPFDEVYVLSPSSYYQRFSRLAWKRVKYLYAHRTDKDVYEVKVKGGLKVKVTSDHSLFKAYYSGGKGQYFKPVKVGEVRPGVEVAVANSLPIDEGVKADLDDGFLTFAGLWVADGFIDREHGVGISTGKEERIVEFLKSFVKSITVKPYGMRKDSTPRLYVNAKGDAFILSREFMRRFTSLGFKGLSKEREVPNWVFLLPNEQLKHFLKGYFSGDGSVWKLKREGYKPHLWVGIGATSVNPNLVRQVQTLLLRFGIPSRISLAVGGGFKKPTVTNLLQVHRVKAKRKFLEEIGFIQKDSENYLPYVIGKGKGSYELGALGVVEVKKLPKESRVVYDLSVEGESFIANNVLLHNTSFLLSSALENVVSFTDVKDPEHYFCVLGYYYDGKYWGHAYVLWRNAYLESKLSPAADYSTKYYVFETTWDNEVSPFVWYNWQYERYIPAVVFNRSYCSTLLNPSTQMVLGVSPSYVEKHKEAIQNMIDYVTTGTKLKESWRHKTRERMVPRIEGLKVEPGRPSWVSKALGRRKVNKFLKEVREGGLSG